MKIGLHIFFILCLTWLVSCVNENSASQVELIEVGDTAPDFSVLDSDDGKVNFTVSDFLGKKTLIVFFVTTCPDCQREMPKVQEAWKALESEGLQLLTVGRSPTTSAEIEKYWENTDKGKKVFTMPWFVEDSDDSVYKKFATKYVPRLYLIDETGVVVWKAVENLDKMGIMDGNDLIAKINEFK